MKGRKNHDAEVSERITISYVELALLFKFSYSKRVIASYLYSGLLFSYALSGSIYTVDSGGNSFLPLSENTLMPFDAGLIIGLEVGIPIRAYRIFLDLRHTLGFLQALNQPGQHVPETMFFPYFWGTNQESKRNVALWVRG